MIIPSQKKCLNRNYLYPYNLYIYENIFADFDINYNYLYSMYDNFINNTITSTIISIESISSFKKDTGGIDNNTLNIYFISDEKFFNYNFPKATGVYAPAVNSIYISEIEIVPTVIHEHTHHAMDVLFKNSCNPYNTVKQATLYYRAIYLTLKDINIKLEANIENPLMYFSSHKNFAKEIIDSLGLECSLILPKIDDIIIDAEKMKYTNIKDLFSYNYALELINHNYALVPVSYDFYENIIDRLFGKTDIRNNDDISTEFLNIESSFKEKFNLASSVNSYKPSLVFDNSIAISTLIADISKMDIDSGISNIAIDAQSFTGSGIISSSTYDRSVKDIEYFKTSEEEFFSFIDDLEKNAYERFLCIYEIYDETKFDVETIALFYESSIESDVIELFPYLYKYHQKFINVAAEEYYLNNTNYCPLEQSNYLIQDLYN